MKISKKQAGELTAEGTERKISEMATAWQVKLTIEYCELVGTWKAHFPFGEIREGCLLGCAVGRGETPDSALSQLVDSVKGKTIIFYSSEIKKKREYLIPESLTI